MLSVQSIYHILISIEEHVRHTKWVLPSTRIFLMLNIKSILNWAEIASFSATAPWNIILLFNINDQLIAIQIKIVSIIIHAYTWFYT